MNLWSGLIPRPQTANDSERPATDLLSQDLPSVGLTVLCFLSVTGTDQEVNTLTGVSQFVGGEFGPGVALTMDRFQKELDDCSRLAQDAKHGDGREFWQEAAERWKALLAKDSEVSQKAHGKK